MKGPLVVPHCTYTARGVASVEYRNTAVGGGVGGIVGGSVGLTKGVLITGEVTTGVGEGITGLGDLTPEEAGGAFAPPVLPEASTGG